MVNVYSELYALANGIYHSHEMFNMYNYSKNIMYNIRKIKLFN